MFDSNVFLMTFENVGLMLLFIAIGFFLQRSGKLPDNAGKVLALFSTTIFNPAYNMQSLSHYLTRDTLGERAVLLGMGFILLLCVVSLAALAARIFGKTELERSSLTYAFTVPNFGYFGFPVIAGVFGAVAKADMIVFCIPFTIFTNSIGYMLFSREKKFSVKTLLLSPMLLAIAAGALIGLSGLQLPRFAENVLTTAGNCMSPASMLLAGIILGKHPLKWLVSGWKSYLFSFIRLLVIPAVFAPALLLLGLRDTQLLIPLVSLSLPLGLNLVVYPESHGYDADDNARLCFVSYIMAIFVLPFTFTIAEYLSCLP